MKTFYYLKSCSTCQRIIKELELPSDVELQNIKERNIDAATLDFLKGLAGSYQDLFSKTSQKYKELGLKDKSLSEQEIRDLILQEYTFLKRPVLVYESSVFIGNAKNTVADAKLFLSTLK